MKKILSCLLAVLLLASFCAMAFAEEEVVPSVEAESAAPEVVEAIDASESDVASGIIVTDLADAEELSEDAQAQMDAAVEALEDLAALIEDSEDLKTLADEGDFDVESVFDISIVGDVELPVEMKLKLDNVDSFAALIHLVDGEPSVIETEVKDGLLSFVLEELGTYAILSFVEAE